MNTASQTRTVSGSNGAEPGVWPHSTDAEEAVLGALMISPESYYEVAHFLSRDDFFIHRNGWIYHAIERLHERGEGVDPVTVGEELERLEQIEAAGGPAYLTLLLTSTPTALNIASYAHTVEETATRRRALQAAQHIAEIAHDEAEDLDVAIDRMEAELFAVSEGRVNQQLIPLERVMSAHYDATTYLYENQDEARGIPTGFGDLDALLGGFQKGDFVLIAGRPGMGKTSFLLSLALNAVRRSGQCAALFSLEMGQDQLAGRLVAGETGIDSQRIRAGRLTEEELGRYTLAVANLSELPIHVDDTPALSVVQLRTKCRRLQAERGLGLVMVDYLQLMRSGARNENRVQEVSLISRRLKEMARELNVPVIAASQLSRDVERRQDKHPVLADLRESGSLEQDADVVMFLYRDEVYDEDTEYPNMAEVIVAKHRNGPVGTANLYFHKQLTRFDNLKRVKADMSGSPKFAFSE
jgi:replicative DNA helicase